MTWGPPVPPLGRSFLSTVPSSHLRSSPFAWVWWSSCPQGLSLVSFVYFLLFLSCVWWISNLGGAFFPLSFTHWKCYLGICGCHFGKCPEGTECRDRFANSNELSGPEIRENVRGWHAAIWIADGLSKWDSHDPALGNCSYTGGNTDPHCRTLQLFKEAGNPDCNVEQNWF